MQANLYSSPKIFSVIQFIKTEEVSVVPTSWIQSIGTTLYCSWPQKKLNSTMIQKHMVPEADWTLHRAKIIKQYDTYTEARKKEVTYAYNSESDNAYSELGKGKRKKRKPSAYDSSSTDSNSEQEENTQIPLKLNTSSSGLKKIRTLVDQMDGRNMSKHWCIDNQNMSPANCEKLLERFCYKNEFTKNLICRNDKEAEAILENSQEKNVVHNTRDLEIEGLAETTSNDSSNSLVVSSLNHEKTTPQYLEEILNCNIHIKTQLKLIESKLDIFNSKINNNVYLDNIPESHATLPKLPIDTISDLIDLDSKLNDELYENIYNQHWGAGWKEFY